MQTTRTPRIVIEDLPALETLSEEEKARIFGAGLFRPTVKALEGRLMLSASAISSLPITGQPNVSVQFTLGSNMDLTETKVQAVGNTSKILGSENLGSFAGGELFQSHDAVGDKVVYLAGNGHLYEFTPNAGFGSFTPIGIPNNNEIIQDKDLDLFFEQAGALYEATGVPAAGSAGAHVLAPSVQAVYQAKDSAGNSAAYTLEGGKLFQVTGSGLQEVAGLTTVAQVGVNGQGQLFALQGNTLYSVSGTAANKAAANVTQVAVDSAGEVVVLQGPNNYTYFLPSGLEVSGSAVAANPAALPQYALDGQGQLYTLQNDVLTVMATSASKPHPLATGVTQMAVDADGEVVVLQGPHAYQYFLPGGLSVSGATVVAGSSALPQYVLSSQGLLYSLAGGVVSIAATSTSAPVKIGQGGVVSSDGSIWYLGTATVDSGGDRAIYQLSNGKVTSFSGSAVLLTVVDGTVYSLNSAGQVFTWSSASSSGQQVHFNSTGLALNGWEQQVINALTQGQDSSAAPAGNPGSPDVGISQAIGMAASILDQSLPNDYYQDSQAFIQEHGGSTEAWFCSANFASYFGPASITAQSVTAVLTGGVTLPDMLESLGSNFLSELAQFGKWLATVHNDGLSGAIPTANDTAATWQAFLSQNSNLIHFEWVKVNYVDGPHLAFGIYITPPSTGRTGAQAASQQPVMQPGQIAINTSGTPVTVGTPQSGGPTVVNSPPLGPAEPGTLDLP